MAKRVIVIGSGIIGASIAYHLAKAGAEVTVIEAGEPGGVATRASWAWINASWGNPEPYFRLRIRSIEHWHKMQSEIPGLAINWCGGLIWDLPPEQLDAYAAERAQWGQPLRKVSRGEIHAIEPSLTTVPEFGYFAPGELRNERGGPVERLCDALGIDAPFEPVGRFGFEPGFPGCFPYRIGAEAGAFEEDVRRPLAHLGVRPAHDARERNGPFAVADEKVV